jgi:hypothetical protein
MKYIVNALQPGQTVLGLAYDFFGEEYDRIQTMRGSTTIVVGVVDTNILLNDLKHSLQEPRLTPLMESARIGSLKLFASTTVRDEVWEKLGIEKITRKLKIDPAEARQRWKQAYLPWITFLDPTGLPLLSARVKGLLKRDPDDVPTGQIIELLQPDVVFCYDKDLVAFDVLAGGWIHVSYAYRDISRQASVMVGVEITGTLTIRVTVVGAQLSFAALEQIYASLQRMDKKILWGMILILVVALGLALACTSSRRWLFVQGQALASAVKQSVSTVEERVGEIAEDMAIIERASVEAKQSLAERQQRALTPPRGVREYAVMALARASGPLSLPELMKRMEAAGYQTEAQQPERYLSHVLHAHPRLFSVEDKCWSLRSHPFSCEQEDTNGLLC